MFIQIQTEGPQTQLSVLSSTQEVGRDYCFKASRDVGYISSDLIPPMACREVHKREFCYKTTHQYFRTISGAVRKGYNPWRDVGLTHSLTEELRRDSGSEPPEVKDDTEVSHWTAMPLGIFNKCAGFYADLYRFQLPLLVDWDYWKPVS